MISRAEAQCRKKGIKLFGHRKLIVELLSEAQDHPDVPELHRRARQRDGRISLPTVYRTVRKLVTAGILKRQVFRRGRARYEVASAVHHDHFIDIATERVIEFHCPEIGELSVKIAQCLGYRLIGHRLELYGTKPTKPSKTAARRR